MTDGDSMTINNLRDSANGTFVTLDDYSHFTVCWRRAGEATVSDMAAQLDHADSDGLLRDRPCTATGCCVLSEEQKEMYVECRSGVNGRPRHGGTRWLESGLERQASRWTTSRCVEVKQRGSTPRGGGVATRNSV